HRQAFAGWQEILEALGIASAQMGRHDQRRDGLSQDIGTAAAEGPLGRRIELHDPAGLVDGDDAVDRDLDDRRAQGLAGAPRGRLFGQVVLGLPQVGQIATEDEVSLDRAGSVTQRGKGAPHVTPAPRNFNPTIRLHYRAREGALRPRTHLRKVFLGEDLGDAGAQNRVFRLAKEPAPLRIDKHIAVLAIEQSDTGRYAIEYSAESNPVDALQQEMV